MPAEAENTPATEYEDGLDEYASDTTFYTSTPQQMDAGTFKQRNDPAALLHRYKLKLLNAYETMKEKEDPDTGKVTRIRVIKSKKGPNGEALRPRVNKQGVEDIMAYVENIVNGHIVQGHIESMSEFRNKMRFIGNDIICHFVAKRQDWACSLSDCDILISNTINLFDLFLTRTLFNKEREGYSEGFKETTHTERKPEIKPNMLQKVGGFLSGKGWA